MNESELKQNILAHSTQFFSWDNKNKGYICPICGSGSGKNGTGITTRDGIHFTCWVGCFTNKDIFDIVGLQYGLSSFREKFQNTAELFGLFQTAAPEKNLFRHKITKQTTQISFYRLINTSMKQHTTVA